MNKEDIIRMAIEANLWDIRDGTDAPMGAEILDSLECFAALVVALAQPVQPATRLELQEAFAAGMSCRPASVCHPPNLVDAAQAVLDRWNSPRCECAEQIHTAGLIHTLRRALDAQPVQPQRKLVGLTDDEKAYGNTDYAGKCAESWQGGVEWAEAKLKKKNE